MAEGGPSSMDIDRSIHQHGRYKVTMSWFGQLLDCQSILLTHVFMEQTMGLDLL